MTAHPAPLGFLARGAFVCLLASTLPAGALAQGQGRQPTRDSAAVKDLPLTPAQRERYIGRYATELPGGEKVTLRIFEENGALRLWASSNPDEPRRLFYQGDNGFLMENAPGFVLTFVLLRDYAIKFTLHKPEGDLQALRIG
jgi:hypothetical protein